jgi:serine/threonine protein kinase/Flp pilus assembly protein TadD
VNEQSLFIEALEKEGPAERADFLDRACAGALGLRERIERLLARHARQGSGSEDALPPFVATIDLPVAECPGSVIGPYKLMEQIGEGGMGLVFVAEQHEPVRRKVALKVIKPGMDTRAVVARFEAERQALALMDHPNIAKVLDGGMTGSGRPYFVMDLVRGVPITAFCDEHHLTPRQRLELFVPVCQAIQHAHQKGVIHRDIKPSNVLVALYDDRPTPKVIDFGVAKAARESLTDTTLVTSLGVIVGTPEYMSPEQATLDNADIDTRSDVYSLGVLLYELLTGSPPFTRKDMEQPGVLEMLRVIRLQEPSRPSTKLSTAKGLPTLAANRGTEPAKLTKLVRGELDWVVMKALEKDRNRRYETASALAEDLTRYLADEPVLACPPSSAYRLRKFVRRNRSGLAVAGLVLFFLVLLGSMAGWAWRDRAARAVERANLLDQAIERAELLHREGKRGEALAALERTRLLAREAEPASPVAQRIDSLQQRLEAEGRDEVFVAQFEAIRRDEQTEVDVEKSAFHQEKAYPKLRAALEQYGITIGVTPPAAAVSHLQQRPAAIQTVVVVALDECLRFVPKEDSATRQWLFDVLLAADSDPWRNQVRRALTQPETLEALVGGIDVRRQPPSFMVLVAMGLPINSPSRLNLFRGAQFAYPGDFWANHQLGWELNRARKPAEAVRYFTAALGLRPDNPGVLANRGNALLLAGELEAAVADFRRAVEVAPRYAVAYGQLGHALLRNRMLDDAIDAYRKALELDPESPRRLCDLGYALGLRGKLDEAVATYRQAIRVGPDDAYPHHAFACFLRDIKHDYNGAIECFHKALELDPNKAYIHNDFGHALRRYEKLEEAAVAFREALRLKPDISGTREILALVVNKLAWSLATDPEPARRDPGRAVSLAKEAVELMPQKATYHDTLGTALYRAGHWKAALGALKTTDQQSLGKPEGSTAFFIAMTHWRLGDKTEARRWYNRAVEWMDKNQPKNEELLRFRNEASELLKGQEKK